MSHDHADKSQHLVRRLQLRQRLEAAGINIFLSDLAGAGSPLPAENESTIEVGQRYPEVLDERLRSAACIVTFLSTAYFRKLKSTSNDKHGYWIQKEWEVARENPDKRIIVHLEPGLSDEFNAIGFKPGADVLAIDMTRDEVIPQQFSLLIAEIQERFRIATLRRKPRKECVDHAVMMVGRRPQSDALAQRLSTGQVFVLLATPSEMPQLFPPRVAEFTAPFYLDTKRNQARTDTQATVSYLLELIQRPSPMPYGNTSSQPGAWTFSDADWPEKSPYRLTEAERVQDCFEKLLREMFCRCGLVPHDYSIDGLCALLAGDSCNRVFGIPLNFKQWHKRQSMLVLAKLDAFLRAVDVRRPTPADDRPKPRSIVIINALLPETRIGRLVSPKAFDMRRCHAAAMFSMIKPAGGSAPLEQCVMLPVLKPVTPKDIQHYLELLKSAYDFEDEASELRLVRLARRSKSFSALYPLLKTTVANALLQYSLSQSQR